MRRLLLIFLLATPLHAEEPLTNADVLRLLKDGVPATVVTAKIKASVTRFDLTTDAIVTLTKAGVPETVLTAMLESTTSQPAAEAVPATKPAGPDMLVWKQECEKQGWADSVCHATTFAVKFPKMTFYGQGARMASMTGDLYLSHTSISASFYGRPIFDLPWKDVETFCTEFAWRKLFYLRTKDAEWKFDIGMNDPAVATYLKNLLKSVRPEKCE
jgi:hypothetical protein